MNATTTIVAATTTSRGGQRRLPLRATLALAAVAALPLLSPPLPAQGDSILLKDGSRMRGVEITAATAVEVTYSQDGASNRVATAKVRDISWGGAPAELGLAESYENGGRFDDAAQQFLEAAGKAARPLVKLDAQFRGARAALLAAGTDAAVAAGAEQKLREYLDAAPDGLRAPQARLLVGRALRLQGKADEAVAMLEELESTAVSAGWGLGWDVRAKYERGLALLAAGKAAPARAAFLAVGTAVDGALAAEGADAELVELKARALAGEGESYLAEKAWDQALAAFRRYSDAASQPPAVVAAALAGEGQALYLQAQESGDAALLRQAQMALARAHILSPDPGTTAKALLFSGKVLLALGDERENSARPRAMGYFDTVVRYYPATPWAAAAREEASK